MSLNEGNIGQIEKSSTNDLGWIDSALSKGKEAYSNMDGMEKMGAIMGGPIGISVMKAPSEASEMKEKIPDIETSIAGIEYGSEEFIDDLYHVKDEWIIGDRNEWFVDSAQAEADNALQAITLSSDKWGHYSVGYLGGKAAAKTADKIREKSDMFSEEYDPKAVAIGGALALGTYAVAKEGYIEGGSGIQFDLDNLDVIGDWTMDTLGMLHSTYNFHKQKTAAEDEDPDGLVTNAAKKAGRTYGKLRESVSEVESSKGTNKIYSNQDKSRYPESSNNNSSEKTTNRSNTSNSSIFDRNNKPKTPSERFEYCNNNSEEKFADFDVNLGNTIKENIDITSKFNYSGKNYGGSFTEKYRTAKERFTSDEAELSASQIKEELENAGTSV